MHPIFPLASRQSHGYSSGPQSPRTQTRPAARPIRIPRKLQAPRQIARKAGQTGPPQVWVPPNKTRAPRLPKHQISDTTTGNLAPLIPAAPLVRDVFSLLLRPSFASPWSVNRDNLTREPGRLRAASHAPARSAGPARLRYEMRIVLRSRTGGTVPSAPLPCSTASPRMKGMGTVHCPLLGSDVGLR